jgi:hypothetical protein
MTIRTYTAGDDLAQVSIYNEAAADLPKFKPATLDEVRRRCRAADFDPSARFFADVNNRPVAYAAFSASGRINYPWCRKGHESLAEPLLQHVLQQMKQRGQNLAWAAYRHDWLPVKEFFLGQGFTQPREIVNWVMDLVDMPTPAALPATAMSPLTPAEMPAVLALSPSMLSMKSAESLEKYLFKNQYFPADSLFVLRGKTGQPVAVGILVANPTYAHPRQVDSMMPCFRLGAFGTEGLNCKRINGLFSVLVPEGQDVNARSLDLLAYAAHKLGDTEIETLGAQVASDLPHLMRFYKQYFTRQGSFPIYERAL